MSIWSLNFSILCQYGPHYKVLMENANVDNRPNKILFFCLINDTCTTTSYYILEKEKKKAILLGNSALEDLNLK